MAMRPIGHPRSCTVRHQSASLQGAPTLCPRCPPTHTNLFPAPGPLHTPLAGISHTFIFAGPPSYSQAVPLLSSEDRLAIMELCHRFDQVCHTG